MKINELKTCQICGKEFLPKYTNRLICYSNECFDERERERARKRGGKRHRPYTPVVKENVRPYSMTTVAMIQQAVDRGESLEELAVILNRDVADFLKFAARVLADGLIDKARQQTQEYKATRTTFKAYGNCGVHSGHLTW